MFNLKIADGNFIFKSIGSCKRELGTASKVRKTKVRLFNDCTNSLNYYNFLDIKNSLISLESQSQAEYRNGKILKGKNHNSKKKEGGNVQLFI